MGIPDNNSKAQCQVILFQWDVDVLPASDPNPANTASKATASDISNHLTESVSFSKTLQTASGTFSFKLDNSITWQDEIYPGQWCLIYLANDGSLPLPYHESPDDGSLPTPDVALVNNSSSLLPNLRGLCYIERITPATFVDEKGAINKIYEVSGRDFGVVYEEADLWYSYFLYERGKVNSLEAKFKQYGFANVHNLLKAIHNLFYAPDKEFPPSALGDTHSLTSVGRQWLLPRPLLSYLGVDQKLAGQDSYYGNLPNTLNFSPTVATNPIYNITDFVGGKAWEKLKTYSIPEFHELFTEISFEGQPTLTFRPIPWGIDQKGYPDIIGIQTYLSLSKSGLPLFDDTSIISHDLGRDNHNRYTHFLVQVLSNGLQVENSVSILRAPSPAGRSFPYADQLNIMRHGFRAMHLTVNSLYKKFAAQGGPDDGGIGDTKSLVQYNEVIYDYWRYGALFESGSMHIVGDPAVKVGMTLNPDISIPDIGGKIYYIEGYTDQFTIGPNGETEWTQTLQLTHGIAASFLNLTNPTQPDAEAQNGNPGDFTLKR